MALVPLVLVCCMPASAAAQFAPPYDLRVLYVLPSDVPYEAHVHQRLIDATLDVQAWYQCATGGLTWRLAYPETVRVYHADHPRAFYATGWSNNFWDPIRVELSQKGLALLPGTVTALWFRSAGWWAGANIGFALLGIEGFPEFNDPQWSGGQCPGGQGGAAWPCTPEGAFAHELGHTVGLPHPIGDPALAPVAFHSLMQTHWNYPSFAPPSELPWGFLTAERESLQSSPFMQADVDLVQRHATCDVVNLPARTPVPSSAFVPSVAGLKLTTTNTSVGASLHYWTFGDGGVSNDVDAVHTYDRPGTYTVELRVSGDNGMVDRSIASVTVAGALASRVDLRVGALAVPTSAGAGAGIRVTDTTQNFGPDPTGATTTKFFVSKKAILDSTARLVGMRAVPPLAGGASTTASTTLAIPADVSGGVHYVIAVADGEGAVPESNENNNARAQSITLGADLRIAELIAPSAATAGSQIAVVDITQNFRPVSAGASTTRFVLSSPATPGPGVVLAARSVPTLGPGGSSSASTAVTIPPGTTPGVYALVAIADAEDTVAELNESNNTRSRTLIVR